MNQEDKMLLKPGMTVVNSHMFLMRIETVTHPTGAKRKIKATGRMLLVTGQFASEAQPINPNNWEIL